MPIAICEQPSVPYNQLCKGGVYSVVEGKVKNLVKIISIKNSDEGIRVFVKVLETSDKRVSKTNHAIMINSWSKPKFYKVEV